MAFATQSDLELALGGADVLRQLADRDQDGVADPEVVEDFLESGAALVRRKLELKHEPETIANLDAGSLRLLRDCNKWLSARVAYLEGVRGQAMPPHVEAQAERMDQVVTEIGTGEARLGRVAGAPAAAMSQPVGMLDYDPLGIKVSITGFRRGFR